MGTIETAYKTFYTSTFSVLTTLDLSNTKLSAADMFFPDPMPATTACSMFENANFPQLNTLKLPADQPDQT
jgi:hypothetical protein